MSRLALYGLLALSLGGIAYCSMHTGGRPNKEYLQLIERLLQEQLNTQPNICVQAGPFPFKAALLRQSTQWRATLGVAG